MPVVRKRFLELMDGCVTRTDCRFPMTAEIVLGMLQVVLRPF